MSMCIFPNGASLPAQTPEGARQPADSRARVLHSRAQSRLLTAWL